MAPHIKYCACACNCKTPIVTGTGDKGQRCFWCRKGQHVKEK